MMRRGLKKQRQISVFYMNLLQYLFQHSIVSEYIVYI